MFKQGSKISIVVSIYNVESYLNKCIYSLRNQIYKNIEIILVVRFSGDKCVEICKAHKAEDDRIILVYQRGKGLVNARKEGTLSATGEYVIHMDGDDWVDDNWLVNVAEYLEHNNPDMIYLSGLIRKNKTQDTEGIQENLFIGEEVCSEIFPLFLNTEECFKGVLLWSVWSWLVKRELLLQQQMLIDDSVYLIEDAVYVFLCLIRAESVALIHAGNYHYVTRNDSGMHTSIGIREGNLETAYRILKSNFLKCNTVYDLDRFLEVFTIYIAFLWDYRVFFCQFEKYLYPYTKVKAGSRVIVYGAGRFGRQIIDVFADRDDYLLVGWVDQNVNKEPYGGRIILPASDISKIVYDYIIIAVLNWNTAQEIKRNLTESGVPDEKIALIDADVITLDKLTW